MRTPDKTYLSYELNNLGQPVGQSLDWQTPEAPKPLIWTGQHARICPLDAHQHASALYGAFKPHSELWTYMPYGPFNDLTAYQQWMENLTHGNEHQFYCITTLALQPKGVFALSNCQPQRGSVELAHVMFGPSLQRTPLATEAVYLVLKYLFSLGYRRCEWKCNALNLASKKAALRFGFSYEGLFRNAMVVKGHNRDTAWFAMTSEDWPPVKAAFERWLDASNFNHSGQQQLALSRLTQPLLRPLAIEPLGTIPVADTL